MEGLQNNASTVSSWLHITTVISWDFFCSFQCIQTAIICELMVLWSWCWYQLCRMIFPHLQRVLWYFHLSRGYYDIFTFQEGIMIFSPFKKVLWYFHLSRRYYDIFTFQEGIMIFSPFKRILWYFHLSRGYYDIFTFQEGIMIFSPFKRVLWYFHLSRGYYDIFTFQEGIMIFSPFKRVLWYFHLSRGYDIFTFQPPKYQPTGEHVTIGTWHEQVEIQNIFSMHLYNFNFTNTNLPTYLLIQLQTYLQFPSIPIKLEYATHVAT